MAEEYAHVGLKEIRSNNKMKAENKNTYKANSDTATANNHFNFHTE